MSKLWKPKLWAPRDEKGSFAWFGGSAKGSGGGTVPPPPPPGVASASCGYANSSNQFAFSIPQPQAGQLVLVFIAVAHFSVTDYSSLTDAGFTENVFADPHIPAGYLFSKTATGSEPTYYAITSSNRVTWFAASLALTSSTSPATSAQYQVYNMTSSSQQMTYHAGFTNLIMFATMNMVDPTSGNPAFSVSDVYEAWTMQASIYTPNVDGQGNAGLCAILNSSPATSQETPSPVLNISDFTSLPTEIYSGSGGAMEMAVWF